MKLLEYSSKEVMKEFGINVQPGFLARNMEEVRQAIDKLNFPVVIKAQVPVGGRGKAGGIKLASNKEEALEKAEKILSMKIKGIPVKKVLVSEAIDIDREFYLGIVIDRRSGKAVVMASAEGGVDIEEVARTKPEAIHKLEVTPRWGLRPFEARELMFKIFDDKKTALKASGFLLKLYSCFAEKDAQLAEINPLALDKQGELWAVDAKILIDDNALPRHPELESLRDMDYADLKELEAKEADLSFVSLDGYIGCCVNGAGLAMATMDIIKKYGGEPANFLDIGGSSRPEKVRKAMEIILRDPKVRSIYFNIFGGITRCDDVAKGLIQAFKELNVKQPVIIRLTGTNEDIARKMLEESGLPLHPVKTMREGAIRAIEMAGEKPLI
ncbi:MAG: ADP-forming succinate--CoA ligase subunit beta [Candidatus Hydrothermae bacterium]|nr:ADP-forming succinate--CoA ligase subunit beta [Candidatus Hydrothermae bacterium]